MTDSDDTDCLLMIPPDLHINIAEEQISQHSKFLRNLNENFKQMFHYQANNSTNFNHKPDMNELSTRNLNLHNTHMAQRDTDFQSQFIIPASSDISSISHENHRKRERTQPGEVLCSTPKAKSPLLANYEAEDFPNGSLPVQHISFEDKNSCQCCNTQSLPKTVKAVKADLQKMSLSDMWQDEEQVSQPSVINLKEEQLRRMHLQKTVQALQGRLLEYQQRLSVAIEVDRCKNEVITTANQEGANLRAELKNYKDKFENLSAEHGSCDGKIKTLQRELSQAVSLVAKFELKNEKLQSQLDDNLE